MKIENMLQRFSCISFLCKPPCLYTPSDDSNFWKKCSFNFKKSVLSENYQYAKAENFLKSNVELNQICKMVLTQSNYIWNLNATDLLYILIKGRRNDLNLYKK